MDLAANPNHLPLALLGDAAPPEPGPREGWIHLPKHGPCFACQTDNPGGLRANLFRDGEVVRCTFRYEVAQMGPPSHAHGGSLAALLDELMGAAAWLRRPNVMAAHLEFDYRRPVPLNQEIMGIGWARAEGARSVKVSGAIRLADGSLAVEATGVFAVARDMFVTSFFG